MPELPEVETVRRGLLPIVGQVVTAVTVHRPDVIEGDRSPAALLLHHRVTTIDRRGKELSLVAAATTSHAGSCPQDPDSAAPRCLNLHLGMTGQLLLQPPTPRASRRKPGTPLPHTHVTWSFSDGSALHFRDPRRFGGVFPLPTLAARDQRWRPRGPDALGITALQLHQRLRASRRPLKNALLDQHVLAGLGNIYTDELLFRCRLHPLRSAHTLRPADIDALVAHMRDLLAAAIAAGGSTLGDAAYTGASGEAGAFQLTHHVYARAGERCHTCGATLRGLRLLNRATVYCPTCQPRRRRIITKRRTD